MYMKSQNSYSSFHGYKNKVWHRLPSIDDILHYERIKIYYTIDSKDYICISETQDFELPSLDVSESGWIKRALLLTKTFDDLESVETFTDKIKKYAGPLGDFHSTPIDFTWIFEKDRLDFYKECILSIWDYDDVEHQVDVLANKEVGQSNLLLENYGIHLVQR